MRAEPTAAPRPGAPGAIAADDLHLDPLRTGIDLDIAFGAEDFAGDHVIG